MLNIYGSPRSSSGRCFWALEEVGAPYEPKTISFEKGEHKSPEFLKINPNGKVPALTDGDTTIWESMAINFYLAENYKPELVGTTPAEKGLVQQWSFWALGELQPPIIEIFIQMVFVPEDKKDAGVIEKAKAKIPPLLEVLNNALENKEYLAGNDFTLADLNTLSVASICPRIGVELTPYKNIMKWLERIGERPAYKRYQDLCK